MNKFLGTKFNQKHNWINVMKKEKKEQANNSTRRSKTFSLLAITCATCDLVGPDKSCLIRSIGDRFLPLPSFSLFASVPISFLYVGKHSRGLVHFFSSSDLVHIPTFPFISLLFPSN